MFEGVADDAFLSCEEVFGPVTSLYRFDELDEALERANAVEFGLSAAIFTSNLATATRFQNEAQAGLIHVNSQTAGADVHVPVRRHQVERLRPARAGPRGDRVLHRDGHGLRRPVSRLGPAGGEPAPG